MKVVKLLMLIVVALCATPARAAIIVNGSFENPTVPNGGFTTFVGGSTAITGWTVVGVDSTVVDTNFVSHGITFQAQDGSQWLDFTGPGTNASANGVTQDITTTIGQLLSLSFYVGSATDNIDIFASTVDLSIDGGARVGYTNPNTPTNMLDWQLYTVQFTATGTTTNLTFFNGSAGNNHLSALDNVSLTAVSAVPEPASVVILGVGSILMFAGVRRRREHA